MHTTHPHPAAPAVLALLADLTPAERQRVAHLVAHTGAPVAMAVAAVKATRQEAR